MDDVSGRRAAVLAYTARGGTRSTCSSGSRRPPGAETARPSIFAGLPRGARGRRAISPTPRCPTWKRTSCARSSISSATEPVSARAPSSSCPARRGRGPPSRRRPPWRRRRPCCRGPRPRGRRPGRTRPSRRSPGSPPPWKKRRRPANESTPSAVAVGERLPVRERRGRRHRAVRGRAHRGPGVEPPDPRGEVAHRREEGAGGVALREVHVPGVLEAARLLAASTRGPGAGRGPASRRRASRARPSGTRRRFVTNAPHGIARRLLDDEAEQDVAGVAVPVGRSGREVRRLVREDRDEIGGLDLAARLRPVARAEARHAPDAGRVVQELAHVARPAGLGKGRDELPERVVERELPVVGEERGRPPP